MLSTSLHDFLAYTCVCACDILWTCVELYARGDDDMDQDKGPAKDRSFSLSAHAHTVTMYSQLVGHFVNNESIIVIVKR